MAQNIQIFIPTYINSADYSPARVQPRLLFYNGKLECEPYWVEGYSGATTSSVAQTQLTSFPYFDNYNVVSGSFPTTGSLSLLYNNETAVYGSAPTVNLYTQYWQKYVQLLYNPVTRLLNCSAIIPLADYFHMELNDIVQFRGNYYHLRAINEYNVKNGECQLQLLGPVIPDTISQLLPPVPTTTTTTTSTTTTTAAPTTTTTTSTTTTTTSTSTTTTTAAPTTTSTTTTTLAPEWYYLYNCSTGATETSAQFTAGTFSNNQRVQYGVGESILYFYVISATSTNPGGIGWSVTSSGGGLTGCPATTTTTTTTTLPPLTISNGSVTCDGTAGDFTSTFSGGSGIYSYVAIANFQSDVSQMLAGTLAGRITLGSGATSYDWNNIANGTWYTGVRDSLGNDSINNTAVTINCTTTTTTTTAAPTTTTTTTTQAPPTFKFQTNTGRNGSTAACSATPVIYVWAYSDNWGSGETYYEGNGTAPTMPVTPYAGADQWFAYGGVAIQIDDNGLSSNDTACPTTTTTTTSTTTTSTTTTTAAPATTTTTTTTTAAPTTTTTTTTAAPGIGFGISISTKYATDNLACLGTITGTVYQPPIYGNTPSNGAQLYTDSAMSSTWTPSAGAGIYLMQFGGSDKWAVFVGSTGVISGVTSCAALTTTTTTTTAAPTTTTTTTVAPATTTTTTTTTAAPTTTTTTTTAAPTEAYVYVVNNFFSGTITDVKVNGISVTGISFPIAVGDGAVGTTTQVGNNETLRVYFSSVSPSPSNIQVTDTDLNYYCGVVAGTSNELFTNIVFGNGQTVDIVGYDGACP